MQRFSRSLLLSSAILLLGFTANAQRSDPYYRDDPYYRGRGVYLDDDYRYRNNGPYAYGRNTGSLINQVMSDISRAASYARVDGHERRHFDDAIQKLREFQDRWAQGKFDQHKLDKAIEDLQHLANAAQLRPRDRDMLANDLVALRDFRANRGQYSNGGNGVYRDDPYYRNRP